MRAYYDMGARINVTEVTMSRRKLMSEPLKQEIAKRLGVDNIVNSEGWGGVTSRNCGNIVREAIEMAERSMT